VVVADNGREAVAATPRERFDVVLMDIHMPIMDGVEATSAIRTTELTNGDHLPIIAMTAQADRKNLDFCLNAGMDGYLAKPVQAESFIVTIEDLCLRPPTSAEPAAQEQGPGRNRINLDAALERVNGDRHFFRQMAGAFSKESPDLMSRIRDGIAGGDVPRAGIAAHTLKNWASGFVAPEVQQAAELIENQLDSGAIACAKKSYEPLARFLDQLADELDRFSRPAFA
jgi:two-component system sensor histidine kinase/response regulator